MKFSWIVTTTWLYMAAILLYILKDKTEFWNDFFWITTCLICIAGFAFNKIRYKTPKERAYIDFLVWLKTFNLSYYIIGLILDARIWMSANIYFIVVVAISAFISFKKYKSWKRN